MVRSVKWTSAALMAIMAARRMGAREDKLEMEGTFVPSMRLFLRGKDGPCERIHVDTRVGRVGEGRLNFAPIAALALKTARKDKGQREADDLSLELALISRAHRKGKGPATWATTFRQDYVEIRYRGCGSYETASDGPRPLLSPNL